MWKGVGQEFMPEAQQVVQWWNWETESEDVIYRSMLKRVGESNTDDAVD